MVDRYWIEREVESLGLSKNILTKYDESHRYYHNIDHIIHMIDAAIYKGILTSELFLAIVFHDIVYDPESKQNEKQSANLAYDFTKNVNIKNAIESTKDHIYVSELSQQLCDLDMSVLYEDFNSFILYDYGIFKEYQYCDYNLYLKHRIDFLTKHNVNQDWITFVKNKKPKIGVFAGSFNPFHIGHYNILKKAETIFDKVIIARGVNPDKTNEFIELPTQIRNRQISYYQGLLTDYIDSLNYDVTLIRGLRSANDFDYESIQYQYLQELKPNIKTMFIICDSEFKHISSSSIRTLMKYNKHHKYLL